MFRLDRMLFVVSLPDFKLEMFERYESELYFCHRCYPCNAQPVRWKVEKKCEMQPSNYIHTDTTWSFRVDWLAEELVGVLGKRRRMKGKGGGVEASFLRISYRLPCLSASLAIINIEIINLGRQAGASVDGLRTRASSFAAGSLSDQQQQPKRVWPDPPIRSQPWP